MNYSEYKLIPPDYYDNAEGHFYPLDFAELCAATQAEDMPPLDEASIRSHVLGLAMVYIWLSGHGIIHEKPLTYAGITGFKEYQGKKLAVVGGVITLPSARGAHLGYTTVGGLLKTAASDQALAEHGHEGFIATCNENSEGLFLNHGFEAAGLNEGKKIMVKEI